VAHDPRDLTGGVDHGRLAAVLVVLPPDARDLGRRGQEYRIDLDAEPLGACDRFGVGEDLKSGEDLVVVIEAQSNLEHQPVTEPCTEP
jgi:hypothetical protein